jgi:DNA-damage-inducible protein J
MQGSHDGTMRSCPECRRIRAIDHPRLQLYAKRRTLERRRKPDMAMTDRINTRIDPKLKKAVEKVFARLGLSAGEAIRLFYAQVKLHQGLPFDVKVPNDETIAAMREVEEGRGLRRYAGAEALFEEWDDESTD